MMLVCRRNSAIKIAAARHLVSESFSWKWIWKRKHTEILQSRCHSCATATPTSIKSISDSNFTSLFEGVNNRPWHLIERSFSTSSHSNSDNVDIVKLSYATFQMTTQLSSDYPVLIIHGLFGSKTNWQSLAKAFSRSGRKIITVDLRNHGESDHSSRMSYPLMCADIIYLLKDLSVPRVSVIGHSLGGKIAMTLALSHPELVDRLIVEDVSPAPSPNVTMLKSFAEFMKEIQIPSGQAMSLIRSRVDEQLKTVVEDLRVRQFILTNLVSRGSELAEWRVNLDAISSCYSDIMGFPAFSNHFSGPSLFIGGAMSLHITKKDYAEIERLFPGAEILHIKDAGHWIHADKPYDFLDTVEEFLDRTED